jgi:hypothetical protein
VVQIPSTTSLDPDFWTAFSRLDMPKVNCLLLELLEQEEISDITLWIHGDFGT